MPEQRDKKTAKYGGLAIDELGYVQQSDQEMRVLFTLLAASYERDGVLLIGDLVFSKWEGIFTNPVTTAAAVGRTVHRSIILELNILSYEMEQAPRDRTQVAAPGEPAGAGSATHTDQ